jgi:hypothetical protein
VKNTARKALCPDVHSIFGYTPPAHATILRSFSVLATSMTFRRPGIHLVRQA